ncbi:hypothetical protein P152DRAFT_509621 [Eremomyces bilateralis CBS 781.70]|uniref:CREG-like beta-barrel domain-containing protein n=1 Tax=Eremomyces bilateralis CBS 781.70 TaxID=1392243 RepID=A0A6G1FT82_9PEZI|nr:uncharacterized protein P152DRAFT_509621 [Eremomyces bilateralis CBS 781.70]KAF1808871.1 hypothetical protein P152DRAFT_509621 [Eremomyces bilateralis CBS 781.70]
MRYLSVLWGLTAVVTSSTTPLQEAPNPAYLFKNPTETDAVAQHRIPTIHESAVQARRILHLENIGTLSTVFPGKSDEYASENRPTSLGGTPIGLMDYFADCEPSTGNPTVLAIRIATSFKNVDAGSNITLSMRWHPPAKSVYSAAGMPRFSLVGHLEDITTFDAFKAGIPPCFARAHPDAVAWLPGNPIHDSHWVRLVVDEVYWIGGFGDRAYIGWIPAEVWSSVTRKEVEECRLPGEKDTFVGLTWLVVRRASASRRSCARAAEEAPAELEAAEKEALISS